MVLACRVCPSLPRALCDHHDRARGGGGGGGIGLQRRLLCRRLVGAGGEEGGDRREGEKQGCKRIERRRRPSSMTCCVALPTAAADRLGLLMDGRTDDMYPLTDGRTGGQRPLIKSDNEEEKEGGRRRGREGGRTAVLCPEGNDGEWNGMSEGRLYCDIVRRKRKETEREWSILELNGSELQRAERRERERERERRTWFRACACPAACRPCPARSLSGLMLPP